MKKLLALVLALVMTMSLVTISNAAYSDAADIDYKEAVDVMSAVGVLEGSDNKFEPKAELTREQAAKIIAYLDLGKTVAEALPSVKVFNDVAADRWSSKFIAYCADAGYIAGVGNGNFDPTGKLTGYAFGKLLLCVLGYDATIEEFTGASWQIKVAKLMESNDLTKGTSKLGSAVLTREEAAQYALNALKATVVDYSNKGTNITIGSGDANITVGASKAEAVAQGSNYTDIFGNTTLQLAEKLYSKLGYSKSTDAFGRSAYKWTYDTKKVGTYVNETPILTYTTSIKEKDLFTDLGADGISGAYAKFIVLDEIYVDGVKVAASKKNSDTDFVADTTLSTRDASYDSTVVIAKGDNSNMAGPGNGVTTQIYAAKDANGDVIANHYKMVVAHEYLTKITSVTKANSTTGADRKVNTAKGSFETEEFAKNDKVLVTIGNDGIATMKLVTKVEDVAVTSYKSDSVTAGGTTYKYSQLCSSFSAKGSYSMKSGDTYTFYLDSNGYIIDGEGYSVKNTDYYLVKAAATPVQADFDTKYDAKYQLVGMDGKVVTVKQLEADATADINENEIVTFENDSDNEGYVKLSVLSNYDSDDKSAGYLASNTKVTSFSKSTASVGDLSFNNSTVFVLKTGASSYKVVNGLSAMDSWTGLASQNIYTVTKDGVAQVAFLDCSATGAGSSSSSDTLVYIIDTSYTTSYDAGLKKNVYTYKTVDGTVTAVANDVFTAEGLYVVNSTESSFVKTATIKNSTTGKYVVVSVTAKEVSYTDGVLTIDGTSYVVDSAVAATIVDTDDNVTTDAGVEALTADSVTGSFTMIKAAGDGTNDTIKTIYFNGTIG